MNYEVKIQFLTWSDNDTLVSSTKHAYNFADNKTQENTNYMRLQTGEMLTLTFNSDDLIVEVKRIKGY